MNVPANSLGYVTAFLAGVVVSFSPCVYPLVPITLGFIGVRAGSSAIKGLIFSLIYVLGLAVTYSILGLIASFTGSLFGSIAMHPVSFLVVGNACIIAGLSFLDVININFTGLSLKGKVSAKSGIFSVFLMGLVSGLAVGPCTAPALGAILVYVASKQNIFYGASLLFVFAYGVGFLLILTGTFSAFFLSLPKSGAWLARIKKFSGFVLIVIGEYFLIKAGRMIW